ncbi:MAG: hypothetical protein JHC70_05080 [Rhodococcus sp.]|nr:hypothetical protein [Rhodococcus sp. (in: high G+C Gram-positive bacteria)]MBJ7321701.1 hypothetical protein [Rhodococcus sp. (in: high G+C Gram-positive bacteria)]
MAKDRYGVVLNDLRLPDDNVHPLSGGWELHKATEDQLSTFKPVLERLYNAVTFSMKSYPPPHEAQITGSTNRLLQWSLKPADWRYWTVHRTNPDGLSSDGLVEALALSDTELFVDYWPNGQPDLPLPGNSRLASPTAMTRFFHDVLGWDNAPQVPDLDELRGLVKLRSEFDVVEYPEIYRILQLFSYTAEIPERSRQKFLAHLAIIEGLLTHKPKPRTSSDQIIQQLKRNIVELDKRMSAPQNCGLDTFGTTDPENVIGTLYNYRNAIAHGKDADRELGIFKAKWPAPLTALELHRFARTLTRRLLVAALREPALVTTRKG